MATAATDFTQLASELEAEGLTAKNAERIGKELAKAFRVKDDEVGILRLDKQHLVFVYPAKLQSVGSIPLNTSSSVAVRTANSKRAEAINNFAQIKHTSIFEAVELGTPTLGMDGERQVRVIQKLMSAPVVGPNGTRGVIQVSRKGHTAPGSGPDFTPADLQRLVGIANSLVRCFK